MLDLMLRNVLVPKGQSSTSLRRGIRRVDDHFYYGFRASYHLCFFVYLLLFASSLGS